MIFRKKQKIVPRKPAISDNHSAPVFSYAAHRTREEENTGRLRSVLPEAVPAKTFWQHIPSIIASLVLIGCAGYATMLDTTPRVLRVTSTAQTTLLRSPEYYERAFSRELQRSLFNRNKLTINTTAVAERLKREYPEVRHISIVLPILGHRPIIQLMPASPMMILSTNQGSYFLDESGKALISTRDTASSLRQVPTVSDESGISVAAGQNALPGEHVEFITTVVYQLQAKDKRIEALTLPAIANELHVRVEGQPYYIKFNIRGDSRQQVGTLLAITERLHDEAVVPAEYIDVRLEDRAFVK